MKFYKVIKDFPVDGYRYKEAKIGDIFLRSFYFSATTKVGTANLETKFGIWGVDIQSFLEMKYITPLTGLELIKLKPHLKKEMIMFDYDISLKENPTLDDVKYIKEKVKRYNDDKFRKKNRTDEKRNSN